MLISWNYNSQQSDQLYALNYKALIDKLESDIELWRTLPMSMIGRINAIKNGDLTQIFVHISEYTNFSV